MDNQAIPPMGFKINLVGIRQDQVSAYNILKEDDIIWARFAESVAYGVVKKYILKLIEELDILEGNAFEKGASLEEIGLRRAVNRLTKANLMSIINKAEKTADTINEKARKDGGEKK